MRLCECGCPNEVVGPSYKRYFSPEHQRAARNRKLREATAASTKVLTKVCEWKKCGEPFTTRKPSQLFCCVRHTKYHWNGLSRKEREARRATKPQRHPNTRYIHEAKADTHPGECIFCDSRTRHPRAVICGSLECKSEYQRSYGRARREREKEAKGRQEVRCACGCGTPFYPRRGSRYINQQHWLSTRRKKKRARAEVRKAARAHGPGIAFGKATESTVLRPFARTG